MNLSFQITFHHWTKSCFFVLISHVKGIIATDQLNSPTHGASRRGKKRRAGENNSLLASNRFFIYLFIQFTGGNRGKHETTARKQAKRRRRTRIVARDASGRKRDVTSDRKRARDREMRGRERKRINGRWRERVLLTKQICTHVLIHLSPSQSYLRS